MVSRPCHWTRPQVSQLRTTFRPVPFPHGIPAWTLSNCLVSDRLDNRETVPQRAETGPQRWSFAQPVATQPSKSFPAARLRSSPRPPFGTMRARPGKGAAPSSAAQDGRRVIRCEHNQRSTDRHRTVQTATQDVAQLTQHPSSTVNSRRNRCERAGMVLVPKRDIALRLRYRSNATNLRLRRRRR